MTTHDLEVRDDDPSMKRTKGESMRSLGIGVVAVMMLGSTGCSTSNNAEVPGSAGTGVSASSAPGQIAWGHWDADENLHMFTANPDGSDSRPLLTGRGSFGAPNWSPDGKTLALYVAHKDGSVTSGLVNADGTGFLGFDPPDRTLSLACFEWSPDGDRLACEGFDQPDPARFGLYTVRAKDGRDLQPVTKGHRVGLCGYSPDGSRIAYLEDDRYLTVVNVDGTGRRRITDTPFGLGCDWSPDGRGIVAASEGSLVLVGLHGTTTQIPLPRELITYGPAFSPDGSSVIFSAAPVGSVFDLYTMRVDGSELVQITHTPEEEDFADWGP
jgi:Tol biopolymer transport system component